MEDDLKCTKGGSIDTGRNPTLVDAGRHTRKVRLVQDAGPDQCPPRSILLEAHKIVNGDRKADYGDSNQNLKNIAELARLQGVEIDAIGVAKVLMSVKLAREGYKHKRDNLVDLCGYAELLNRLYEEGSK